MEDDIAAARAQMLRFGAIERRCAERLFILIDTLRAERDAALARALPEAVLMETAEQVEALPEGNYLVRRFPNASRFPSVWRRLFGVGRPWATIGSRAGHYDDRFVGAWIIPLPDLPIPTTSEEGQGNG